MNFLEKNLEDIIFNSPKDELKKRGIDIRGKIKRQVKIGNYGIADIVSYNINKKFREIDICVYELKKEKIDANSMMQAFRYCKGIQRYFEARNCNYFVFNFSVCLVGKNICTGDFCYLNSFLDNVEVLTYDYDFDGIKFKNCGTYSLREEGFNV